jgi:uncharacterized membrane protein
MSGRAGGILKMTRHPSFIAFTLFGLAHMLMNGWAGDVVFFGCFPTLDILGGLPQDRRKLLELGEPYQRFAGKRRFFQALLCLTDASYGGAMIRRSSPSGSAS